MLVFLKVFAVLLFFTSINGLKFEYANVQGVDRFAGRITGGDLANEKQFPYQVGLNIEFVIGQYNWCGGTLISKRWVLTAAHCVASVKTITAYFGSVKRLKPSNVHRISADSVFIHHDWNSRTLENDIALLCLPMSLTITDTISPVNLPRLTSIYSSYAYNEAIATGWGRMSDASASISNDLRYIIRFVESNAECQFIYGTSVRPTNICIDTTGGKSTCSGDSGGPLVLYDDIIGFVLIGVNSFGKSSGCTKGYPAVFTRVTSYLDWIQSVSDVYLF